MHTPTRYPARFAAITLATMALTALFVAPSAAQDNETTWTQIQPDIFGDRPIEDGTAVLDLVAPTRAEDAAIVPLTVRIHVPSGEAQAIKALTLVIDENPAPVAATFALSGGHQAFELSTRVRVNSYSFVRAIAETGNGKLYMVKAFVKAAGGCSAPAAKDPAEAKANIGQMRFRAFAETGREEAQVQIRHPNYSGLQMDQVTRLYTPAWYVQQLKVSQGDRPLFSMEGGISISEDPTFRFTYKATTEPVSVEAKDTEGRVFKHSFPAQGS